MSKEPCFPKGWGEVHPSKDQQEWADKFESLMRYGTFPPRKEEKDEKTREE